MKPILRPYQCEAHAAVFDALMEDYKSVLITAATGTGKCLGKGTPVLMYSGETRNVEDIKTGECLMGPDSRPRRVLSTCSGKQMLYRVTPTKGEPYIVNEDHVLSLKMTNQGGQYNRKQPGGTIVNIPVHTYIASNKTFKHCAKGWKPCLIEFPEKWDKISGFIDPYFLGVWLGDGHSKGLSITTCDQEVIDYLHRTAFLNHLEVRVDGIGGRASTYHLHGNSRGPFTNSLWDKFLMLDLKHNKHIPMLYKTASPPIRRLVLAGIIDTDGSLCRTGYDICLKSKHLSEDVTFIARSLGYAAYMKPCKKTCTNNGKIGDYYRIFISGDLSELPVLIPHKKAPARNQIKDVLLTGIKVEPIGEGEYYGFTIDGDHLFLLGDFTVTHNTVIFSEIIRTFLSEYGWKVLVLAPRKELIGQAYKKVRDMCGLYDGVDVDKEQGENRFDTRARVVIGSRQTCYKETRLQGWIPDVIIVDECHEGMCPQVQAIFARFPDAIRIGVTATAHRGDKKPIFSENIDGSMVMVQDPITRKPRECTIEEAALHKHIYNYELKDAVNDGWLVEPHGYKVTTTVDISQVKSQVGSSGDFDFSQSGLNAVLEADQQVIVDRINAAIGKWKEVASDRPTLVFCSSVEYAKWAAKLWQNAGYTSQAIDANTSPIIRDTHIEEIHKGNVQVTTNYGIYIQGTDVDKWSCIVMLRPTKSPGVYMQALGRGTRPLDTVGNALGSISRAEDRLALIAASAKPDTIIIDVVDICGKHEICTLPTALGLPASLDLQGKGLMQAAPVVAEFEKNKEAVMEEGCPATYQELEATLSRIELLNKSGAHRGNWLISENGSYYYGKAPPGYIARLTRMPGEGIERWNLQVVACGTGEVLVDNTAPRRTGNIKDYFDSAASRTQRAIHTYMDSLPKVPTWDKLSKQEKYYMTASCKLTKRQVNELTLDQCRDKIKVQRRKYWAQKGKQQ